MKKKIIILILIGLFLLNSVSSISSIGLSISKNNSDYTSHGPIHINGNDEFTAINGVTSGSGTENEPSIPQNNCGC